MWKTALIALVVAAGAVACGPSPEAATASGDGYMLKVLVANRPELAHGSLVDTRMINPWGIALRPPGVGGHIWISNAGNLSTSTYIGDAKGVPLHQDGLKIIALDSPLLSYVDGLA